MPVVYGFSDKKVFHSSILYHSKLYIYGGIDNNFITLNFPNADSISVNESLFDYTLRCK